MEIVKQISVFTANKSGVLANVCGFLTDEKISLQGVTVVDHSDHALIRLVTSDPEKALHLLGEAGMCVIESDIIRIELTKAPGSLEKILKIASDGDLDILYLYGSEPEKDHPVIFLNLNDNLKGLDLIKKKLK